MPRKRKSKKTKKAVIRKTTRKPRRDAWYMVDIASRHKDIIPRQSRQKALKLQRSGRECVFYWDLEREKAYKKHPNWADQRWELWCKKVKGVHKL